MRRSSCATTCSASSAIPAATGKPAGDDLREGKRTYLVAAAFEAATEDAAGILTDGLGRKDLDPAGIDRLREIIVSTGALDRTERRIAELTEAGLAALASSPLADGAARMLTDLALAATRRTG